MAAKRSIWNKEQIVPLMIGLRLAKGTLEHLKFSKASTPSEENCAVGLPLFNTSLPTSAVSMKCSYCNLTFASRQEQVNHYGQDLHRANLKRSMEGKKVLTEEQFMNNISSSSESESDEEDPQEISEEDQRTAVLQRQPQIYFVNTDGIVFSLFRCLLTGKKREMSSEEEVIQQAMAVPYKCYWSILMIGGGHFAGAVIKGEEILAHKTFHSYTVRSKQGGSQSSKDKKNGNTHCNSAGSSLRRHNEQSFMQHVQEVLRSWQGHLNQSHIIMLRATNTNKKVIFGGPDPPLKADDLRIRTIPFSTEKPTFKEVRRVHTVLSEITVHGTEDDLQSEIASREKSLPGKNVLKPSSPKKKINEVKEKKVIRHQESCTFNGSDDSSLSEDSEYGLCVSTNKFSPLQLEEMDCYIPKNKSKRRPHKNKRQLPKENSKAHKSLPEVRNLVYTACRSGDMNTLKAVITYAHDSEGDQFEGILSSEVRESIKACQEAVIPRSFTFGKDELSLLHIAATACQKDVIWYLMENDCDPSIKSNKGELPYKMTTNKQIRNTFRRFMSTYPSKYDYKEAGILSALSEEQEKEQAARKAEKKRVQRKAKREKEKETKKIEEERTMELAQINTFLSMTDREKRALAAERRLAAQQESQQKAADRSECISQQRCFQ
ncbi:tRNA endonuclease ANKZF1-like [Oratosquilla oratoria]|uniref:tRNA endonuclease ANKZF1-like n=1 Tax=Oratosquilla oratoria TaxID=337810 RepID=UPI003F764AB8